MTDDISKVVPFWEWKEKQKAIDAEANGGVPLLRSKDWYHREYGKYVAATPRQGYASFNKGTLTVDVGRFLKDTRTESATPAEVVPVAWRFDYCGVKPMVWLEKPAENAPMFTNIRALVYADDHAALARQLAEAPRRRGEVDEAMVERAHFAFISYDGDVRNSLRAALQAAAPAHPSRGVVDDVFIAMLAEEAYRVHSATRVGPYPNDSHAPKWQAVVRMVIAALTKEPTK